MKKRKKVLLLSFASIISLGTVATAVISCAVDPNKDITPTDPNTAYVIYKKDGTKVTVSYSFFIQYLKDHPGANTSDQVQYDNQIIKWLYKDEYYSSIVSHAKSGTSELTSYDKEFLNATDNLNDAKKSIRSEYGIDWEAEWAKQLLSTKYGGSLSEKQAIEYLAVQSMKSDALKRFTLKIDTSTYTSDEIGKPGYDFLNQADAPPTKTPDKYTIGNAMPDNNNKKAISLITSSYNDLYKTPYNLLNTYMKDSSLSGGYKTVYNIRHVLYALKAGTKPTDAWTLSTSSMKKMYQEITTPKSKTKTQVYKSLSELGSNKDNWAANPFNTGTSEPASSLVGKILNNSDADNAATAKTYGSLGMSTLNESLTNLVPGFAIPIVVNDYAKNHSEKPLITPKVIKLDMDKALVDSGDPIWKTTAPSSDTNIDNDITKVFSDPLKLKKTLISLKSQFADGKGTRKFEYSLGGATGTNMVFSADGIHMIYQEKLTGKPDKVGGLYPWIYSDLINTKNGDSAIYNVIKEVNSKMTPSDNFLNIYPLVNAEPKPTVPGYQNPMTFNNFVKTQTDYAHTDNSKFTKDDAAIAKRISTVLKGAKKDLATLTLSKKYRDWWNKTIITNKLIYTDPKTLPWSKMNSIIQEIGKAK